MTRKPNYYDPDPDKLIPHEKTLAKAASIEAQVLKNAKTSGEIFEAIGDWCCQGDGKFFKFMSIAYGEKDAIEWLALAFMLLQKELVSNQELKKLSEAPPEQREKAIKEFFIAQGWPKEATPSDSKQTA